MKVFIQNEAGSATKHVHNEKTLELLGTRTVSRPYPFPYGFILNTTAADECNVDCFVLTEQPLRTGQVVECEPIALMEQIEDGKEDHNVLAVVEGDPVALDASVEARLTQFVQHVFDHIPGKRISAGEFLDRAAALAFIAAHRDAESPA